MTRSRLLAYFQSFLQGCSVNCKLAFLSIFVLIAISQGFGESFRDPVRIATGTDPNGVLVADLNGDGKKDILWTARQPLSSDPTTVHTQLAQADGSFATGTVQFSTNFSPTGSSNLVNGAASLTTTFAQSGSQQIAAVYSGNVDYNSGSSPLLSVNVLMNATTTQLGAAPNPAVAAQPITFTARVTSSTAKQHTPSGTVQFMDNGGQIGAAQLANGTASLTLSSLAVGTHSILATYQGDNAFNPSNSSPGPVVIEKASSSIALSASPNPAIVKTSVTFRATVKGPRQPTGSVVFYEGSKPLTAALPVDFEGTATFSTAALAVGTHSIVADYSGDPNLNASASVPLSGKITP